MTLLLAHSAQKDIPAQSYKEHVHAVYQLAKKNMHEALNFFSGPDEQKAAFRNAVGPGALFHDLGKIDKRNQKVLAKADCGERLPLNHVDAGTAWLWKNGALNSSLLVYCHHSGLFSLSAEKKKEDGKLAFRDEEIAYDVDDKLSEYVAKHGKELPVLKLLKNSFVLKGLSLRLALSCLVDADHHDTACHYGGELPGLKAVDPQWTRRLKALDRYVCNLSVRGKQDLRNKLRSKIYKACRDAPVDHPIKYCDAPVGTGKTTAVMAHLLSVAAAKNLRHIFVVLPYTNIIEQSVDVYRKALVLDGETPEEIVAAHYHQADFSDLNSRQLATLWKAPIIVTSAVQFFET
ncbi:MAG: CRISPR-associated endonuclease Cas3'', partial [Nitrospiraceae bacterium]|nr:CRISPR-associated endonuclease Cas3'' [Nitrospiraceae bacterium]